MTTVLINETLTVTEAAELLQVSTSTIWRWINQGDLPAYRVGRRRVRVRRADDEQLVRPRNDENERDEMLTGEERQQVLETINRLRATQAEQLAARDGELFPDSVGLLHSLRAERDDEAPT